MKKIRKSKFLKTVAFILAWLSFSSVLLNVFTYIVINEENLLHADKSLYEKTVYSYAADLTANDLVRYVEISGYLNKDPDDAYLQKEIELFESKYNITNSNVAFTVKDENGKTVLENFKWDQNSIFTTYEKPLSIQIIDTDNDTVYIEEPTAYINEPSDTTFSAETTPEPDTADPKTVTIAESSTENTTEIPIPVTQITDTEITAPMTAPPVTYIQPHDEVIIRYPADDLNLPPEEQPVPDYIFKYVYPAGELNEKILDYCYSRYNGTAYMEYAPHEFIDGYDVYNQKDYLVSANGVVYYSGQKNDRHTGEDYFKEYTATIMIPVKIDKEINDFYPAAQSFADLFYEYSNILRPLTAAEILIFLISFIFLMAACGYVKGQDLPVARGIHKVPYEIILLLGVGFFFGVLITGDATDEVFFRQFSQPLIYPEILFYITFYPLLFLSVLETFVVRIKSKTFLNGLFTVRFGAWLIKLFKASAKALPLVIKGGLFFLGITFIDLILLLSGCIGDEEEFAIIFFIIFKLLEGIGILLLMIAVNTLQKGAKSLSEGQINKRISNPFLFGELKKNANYLNSINDGMTREINKRLKSESMKTELITNVSHDLKTPLTSLINYTALLKKEQLSNEKAIEYIDVIDRQSQKLKKLTADIIDASKASTGNLEINKEKMDLNVILSQVQGEYRDKLEQRRLQLECVLPNTPIGIYTDGRLLWRVFDNIMNNICKYSLPGSRVYMTLNADKYATILFRNISETKLNISPEELTERFVRGDASRHSEGSGLGLSIAKSITEQIGGQFDIAIDGDLFKVTLIFPVVE